MNKPINNILNIACFSFPKGSKVSDVETAVTSVVAAHDKVVDALADRERKTDDGVALRRYGFIVVNLVSPGCREKVVFDAGQVSFVDPETLRVVEEGNIGDVNAANASSFLTTLAAYAAWCGEVEKAAQAHSRPPAFDQATHGEATDAMRAFCGLKAESYVRIFREARHAARVAAADPANMTIEVRR